MTVEGPDSGGSSFPGRSPVVLHRGRMEIIASLLEAAKDGKGRTRLMYAADLDSRGLKKYLEFLVARKFIEVSNTDVRVYSTTEKGLELLEAHKHIELLQNP